MFLPQKIRSRCATDSACVFAGIDVCVFAGIAVVANQKPRHTFTLARGGASGASAESSSSSCLWDFDNKDDFEEV